MAKIFQINKKNLRRIVAGDTKKMKVKSKSKPIAAQEGNGEVNSRKYKKLH